MEDNHFVEVDDAQLDHLVPVEERVEPGLAQDEEPASLESESHVDPETAQTICQFRTSCEMVEQVAGQQAIWDHATVHALGIYLQQRAQEQTPSQHHYDLRDSVIKRIDEVVKGGLLQFKGLHVQHYGSYTSGLFTPSGDLDIAIEGRLQLQSGNNSSGREEYDYLEGKMVYELDKEEKAALLRALVKKLERKNISLGRPQGIFHARVPIVKFVDALSDIPCDMAVGSGGARFKSTVLRHLSLVDSRFADLTRIVKLWAKAYSMNDASQGTFNTFALTLMIVFHLQTRSPPILPPICHLFDLPADCISQRPLHRGRTPDMYLLEESERRARAWKGEGNQETLLQLLSSFFALYSNAVAVWTQNRDKRAVRCCTWAGRWSHKAWGKKYMVPVEDPFDATDNCARSIFAANAEYVTKTLRQCLMAVQKLPNTAAMEEVIRVLFEEKEKPYIRHPFAPRGAVRAGWNEVGWGGGGRGRDARGARQEGYGRRDGRRLRQGEQREEERDSNRAAGPWQRSDAGPVRMPLPPGFEPTAVPRLSAEMLAAQQGSVDEAVRRMAAMHMQGQIPPPMMSPLVHLPPQGPPPGMAHIMPQAASMPIPGQLQGQNHHLAAAAAAAMAAYNSPPHMDLYQAAPPGYQQSVIPGQGGLPQDMVSRGLDRSASQGLSRQPSRPQHGVLWEPPKRGGHPRQHQPPPPPDSVVHHSWTQSHPQGQQLQAGSIVQPPPPPPGFSHPRLRHEDVGPALQQADLRGDLLRSSSQEPAAVRPPGFTTAKYQRESEDGDGGLGRQPSGSSRADSDHLKGLFSLAAQRHRAEAAGQIQAQGHPGLLPDGLLSDNRSQSGSMSGSEKGRKQGRSRGNRKESRHKPAAYSSGAAAHARAPPVHHNDTARPAPVQQNERPKILAVPKALRQAQPKS